MYARGYLQGYENGRVVTIDELALVTTRPTPVLRREKSGLYRCLPIDERGFLFNFKRLMISTSEHVKIF